ncbi:MAG: hypothetical protein ABI647_01255 [Gemmatimonadota bacterium]
MLGFACTWPLQAQDSVIVVRPEATAADSAQPGGLPAEVVRELIGFYNDSTATRMVGSFLLPKTASLAGHVAVFRGTLRVYGHIDGPVVVINGDLLVADGGQIIGNALVVGGRIEVRAGGLIAGTRRAYEDPAPLYRMASGLVAIRERPRRLSDIAAARASFQAGRIKTTLSLETGRTYNRTEGLPIVFGPTFTGNPLPTIDARLDARAIFRPAADRRNLRDDVGFVIQTEWAFGEHKRFGIGGRGYRVIDAVEDQPLSRGESGWSAFLFQRDYRDYFEIRGQGAYGFGVPIPNLRVEGSIRWDDERSVRAGDPVSLFRNSDTWRPNPLIDDGHYLTSRIGFDWDTRNDVRSPTSGWLIHAHAEHSSSNDAAPVTLPTDVRAPIDLGHYSFSRVWFDVRRFARFNPTSRVNGRLVGGGWVAGDPLAVQRRYSLGGPDILPGYSFRAMNCAPPGSTDPALTALCDRMIAVQLEVRTRINVGLPFRITNRDFSTLQRIVGLQQADLVLFGDGGKAWLSGDGPGRVPNDRIPNLGEWKFDAGVGVDAGGLGVYLAKALSDNVPFRVVVRLQRRF